MGSSLIPTQKKKIEIPLPSEGRPIFFSVSGPARPIPAQPNFIYLFFLTRKRIGHGHTALSAVVFFHALCNATAPPLVAGAAAGGEADEIGDARNHPAGLPRPRISPTWYISLRPSPSPCARARFSFSGSRIRRRRVRLWPLWGRWRPRGRR